MIETMTSRPPPLPARGRSQSVDIPPPRPPSTSSTRRPSDTARSPVQQHGGTMRTYDTKRALPPLPPDTSSMPEKHRHESHPPLNHHTHQSSHQSSHQSVRHVQDRHQSNAATSPRSGGQMRRPSLPLPQPSHQSSHQSSHQPTHRTPQHEIPPQLPARPQKATKNEFESRYMFHDEKELPPPDVFSGIRKTYPGNSQTNAQTQSHKAQGQLGYL